MKKLYFFIIFLLLASPTAALSGQIKTLNIRIGSTTWDSYDIAGVSQYDVTAVYSGSYDDLGTSPNTWQQLKAINPNIIVAVYKHADATSYVADIATRCSRNQVNRWFDGDGVDLDGDGDSDEAISDYHADWIMHKADCTTPLDHLNPPSDGYFLDVGNADYQDYWWQSTSLDLYQQTTSCGLGADGVMVDHAYAWENAIETQGSCATESVATPTSWRTAMANWVDYQATQSALIGKKLLLNADGWPGTVSNTVAYWADIDGNASASADVMVLAEGMVIKLAYAETPSNYKGYVDGVLSLSNISYAVFNRCPSGEYPGDSFSVTGGDGSPYTWFEMFYYSLATYYLAYTDRAYHAFMSGNDYNNAGVSGSGPYANYYISDYDLIDLGEPSGAYTMPYGSGNNATFIFRREFEHGIVLVNAGTAAVNDIALGEACKQISSTDHSNVGATWTSLPSITTISLRQKTGAILYKESALSPTLEKTTGIGIGGTGSSM